MAGPRFARVPPRAAAARLTRRGYGVLIAICGFADGTGRAHPSVDTIAKAAAIDRSKVPDRVKEIEAAKLLRVTRAPGRSSFYEILFDDPTVLPVAATPDDPTVLPVAATPVARGGNTVLPPGDQTVAAGGNQTERRTERKNPPLSARERAREDGFFCLDEWQPDPITMGAWAEEKVPELEDPLNAKIIEAFKDNCRWKRKDISADPDAAFRLWLRKEPEYARRRRRDGVPPHPARSPLIKTLLKEAEEIDGD
jgi:Helix-turn-helix domain